MLNSADLRAEQPPTSSHRVEKADPCPVDLYRMLYAEVGRRYHWVDRLGWTDETIRQHLARAEIGIWTLKEGPALAGYFELVRHPDGSVEIAYFGLLHAFLGRGLGKYLLTEATRRAWECGANRVWLHTCTLDHPAALPNYLARGFREFKREKYTTDDRRPTADPAPTRGQSGPACERSD